MAREIDEQQEMIEEMIGELERARRENERLILKLERANRREKEAIAQKRFVNISLSLKDVFKGKCLIT